MKNKYKNNPEKLKVWKADFAAKNPDYMKPGNIGWASQRLCEFRTAAVLGRYEPPNITNEQLVALYKAHDHCCDICGCNTINNGREMAIDHNHQTGNFRGWLCHRCNRGLGQFKDSSVLLQRAKEYLEN